MDHLMVGVALPNRYWKTSTIDGTVITTSTIYENLWMSCATDSTGVHNCREFPSLLALNGYIQASRALMIILIVLGTFGLVAALIGVQCSKAGGENYVLKGRIAGTAGVLFILQGVCTMVSVSWYAFNITQDFFDPFYPGIRYEIGDEVIFRADAWPPICCKVTVLLRRSSSTSALISSSISCLLSLP
ncbi:claudin-15-like [Melanotaenia boesemani]|uniref:claudin-15-like n=1 Tax=Melanotaenia boesemani TaxID=1250792 RepID=UPI001C04008D|nr:claudin-15-like [Melanotaenia boesemani]